MLEKQKYLKKKNDGEIEIFRKKEKSLRNRKVIKKRNVWKKIEMLEKQKCLKKLNVGEIEIFLKIEMEKQKY